MGDGKAPVVVNPAVATIPGAGGMTPTTFTAGTGKAGVVSVRAAGLRPLTAVGIVAEAVVKVGAGDDTADPPRFKPPAT